MDSINHIVKSFATKSSLSSSMVSKISFISDLFDEILNDLSPKLHLKIVQCLHKIYSDHSKNDSKIKDFQYYFERYDNQNIKDILRFLSCFFHLLNQSEIQEIIYKNKLKSKQSNLLNPLKDSIHDAIKYLRDNHITYEKASKIIENILFEPTLTSHPTEFRRISLLNQQNKILQNISQYLFEDLSHNEKNILKKKIKNQIFIFMNTDDQRNTNLSPHDEIKNSIFLMFSSVWESIPLIYSDYRDAFEAYYDKEYSFKKNINFCTWIGGDRDGNPNITSQTTSWALKFQRIQVLKKYIDSIETLFHELSLERKLDLRFESDINEDLKFLSIDEKVKLTHENETIRLKLLLIKKKLEKNLHLIEHDEIDFKYKYQDFKQDLLSLKKHLNDNYPINLFKDSSLENLIIRVSTFEFNLLELDIRQHSDSHSDLVTEVISDYSNFNEQQKQDQLKFYINSDKKIIKRSQLSKFSLEVYKTFEVIVENLKYHPNSIKSYIVSMTHETSDILEVLFIFNQVKLALKTKVDIYLNIIPLYETIYDLNNAKKLLDELLSNPSYKIHLKNIGNFQEVMLGYSDSNKDGGIFMANYSIQSCIRNINQIFIKHDVDYSVFHGRGGSISRGGGKSNEAIMSLPSFSEKQKLRMTEQGEIISYRYSNPDISKRHLEQILSALVKSSIRTVKVDSEFENLKKIAYSTFNSYKKNIINLEYWRFFIKSTPINYISRLKISSRPFSRNKISIGKMGYDEIRAIPWVSSWIQTRYNISGWFGIGEKINDIIDSGNLKSLQALYLKSSFFRNIMDNITFEMARARIPISKKYSQINNYTEINCVIEREFKLIEKSYLQISGNKTLLERNPVIENLIKFRNPITDLLNIIQIEYLSRVKNEPKSTDIENEIIISSINGIAAAMQTTG